MYSNRYLRIVFLLVLVAIAYAFWGCPNAEKTVVVKKDVEKQQKVEQEKSEGKKKSAPISGVKYRKPTEKEIWKYLDKHPINLIIALPKGYKGPVSSDIIPKVNVRKNDILITLNLTPVTPKVIHSDTKGDDSVRAPTAKEIEDYCKGNPQCIKEVEVPAKVTESDVARYCKENPDECKVYTPAVVTDKDVRKYCKKNPKKCEKKVIKWKTRSPKEDEIKKFCKKNPKKCQNPVSVNKAPVVSHEEKRIGCMYRTYVNMYTSSNVFALKYIYPNLDKKVSVLRLTDKSRAISNSAQIMCAVPGERLLVNLESEEGVLVTRKNGRFKYNGTFYAELVDGKTVKLKAKPVIYKGEPFLELQIPEEK